MSDSSPRRSVIKRIVFVVGGLLAFTLVFVIAVRVAVMSIFRGIETQKATGLAAIDPFARYSAATDLMALGGAWVSKSAALQMHATNFDQSVSGSHHIVAAHQGYLEDLRTESRSGNGRTLSATVSVPSADLRQRWPI